MVKIEKLKSGSYRTRVNIGNGKYKSITGATKKEVQLKAAEFEANIDDELAKITSPVQMELREAMDKYCEIKKNVISPTSYREYKRKAATYLTELHNIKLADLTAEKIQIAINNAANTLSAKSVRDIHGFLSAVLKQYYPEFILHTTLPQRDNNEIIIPSEETIAKLFEISKDTVMELPIILASCCAMRRSEILGLKWNDIDFDKNTMRISEAKVIDINNELVSKKTKTYAGTRTIRLLPQVREALLKYKNNQQDVYIVNLTPAGLHRRYSTMLKKISPDLHYRFHDLRHYGISVMLALNIPKRYIADFVGHETEDMIDNVYGHIMKEKKTEIEDILADYYEKIYNKRKC